VSQEFARLAPHAHRGIYSAAASMLPLLMATMTGECSIDEIRMGGADEAAVVVGSFVSHADGDVGEG
jgi:hypothetical protein